MQAFICVNKKKMVRRNKVTNHCICEQEEVQPFVWHHDQHITYHLQQGEHHGEGQAGPDCADPATSHEAGHPPPHIHLHRLTLH